ncbi:MAG: hypothetical protein ABIQ95_00395 [Bdellovibrionia bacterium]
MWFFFWFGVGVWVTKPEKITIFQKSWEGLGAISKLEYCDEKPKVKLGIGKAASQFIKLKQALGGTPTIDDSKQKKDEQPEEPVCKGRLPDEPWFHFRYRLTLGHLDVAKTAWGNFSSIQSFHRLLSDFASRKEILGTGAARLFEWFWVLLNTGEKQTSFHQVWIENPLPSLASPSSEDLAHALISPEAPDWKFVQRLVQFLLPEPHRWKSDPVAPSLFRLPERGFCQKVAKDPTLTTHTKSVWKHLRLFYEGCERRKREFGKLPGECAPEKIRKALTIACIEKRVEDQPRGLQRLSTPLQWPGLPSSLLLSTQTLAIPDNYFETDSKKFPYRGYRLAHAIEQTLLGTLETKTLAEDSAIAATDSFDFDRPQLLTAPAFELTRLQMLETISPLGPQELAPDLQAYFWYDRFGPRIERFQVSFNRRLHKIKGELE